MNTFRFSGVQAEDTDEWDPKLIQEAQVEVMMDDNTVKDEEALVSAEANHNSSEVLFPISTEQPTIETEQPTPVNGNHSEIWNTRRRYLIKKRYRPILPAAANIGPNRAKYEDLNEKNARILAMKEETAFLEREIAKTNLAAAKTRLRTAEIELETAALTKKSKLIS